MVGDNTRNCLMMKIQVQEFHKRIYRALILISILVKKSSCKNKVKYLHQNWPFVVKMKFLFIKIWNGRIHITMWLQDMIYLALALALSVRTQPRADMKTLLRNLASLFQVKSWTKFRHPISLTDDLRSFLRISRYCPGLIRKNGLSTWFVCNVYGNLILFRPKNMKLSGFCQIWSKEMGRVTEMDGTRALQMYWQPHQSSW